jgi:hypothetical protein
MRTLKWIFACSVIVVLLFGTIYWWAYNPLAKYGVTYTINSGEHAEYQWVNFYLDRDGKRINGPEIHDDDLSVSFKQVDGDNVPEIVVQSDTYRSHSATLKLNLSDRSKPEFELVECHDMKVEYMDPWWSYYKEDPETHETFPVPAK